MQSRDQLVEAMARARVEAMHTSSLDEATWQALRSRVEEKWMAAALPVVVEAVLARIEAALAQGSPLPAWDVAAEIDNIRAEWGAPR